jgi:hypothetical protein
LGERLQPEVQRRDAEICGEEAKDGEHYRRGNQDYQKQIEYRPANDGD